MTRSDLSPDELLAFMERVFPGFLGHWQPTIEHLTADTLRVRFPFQKRWLRPGNTIAGPALMTMADTAAYMVLLFRLGIDAAPAATSNLNINFLRRPNPVDVVVQAKLIKVGRRLVVSAIELSTDDHEGKLVAHAMVTYALPSA